MSDQPSAKPRIYTNLILCESVIRDQKTNVLTAIRIANGFTQEPFTFIPHLQDGSLDEKHAVPIYPPFSVSLVCNFHSEEPIRFSVTISAVQPNGKSTTVTPEPIPCEIPQGTDTHALNIRGSITTPLAGLYWFEVYIDGELAGKAPLRIIRSDTKVPDMESLQTSATPQQQSLRD